MFMFNAAVMGFADPWQPWKPKMQLVSGLWQSMAELTLRLPQAIVTEWVMCQHKACPRTCSRASCQLARAQPYQSLDLSYEETAWMNLVLDRFDNIASNIANTSRVQVRRKV